MIIHVGAIAVWLLAQFTSLILTALRVPLWARPPLPIESVAAEQMIVVQIVCAAMLFCWLMSNRLTSMFVILTSAPMLMFAGVLSASPLGNLARGWIYLCVVLIALACWSAVLRGRRARLGAIAVVSILVLGMPIIRYLSSEHHHSTPLTSRMWLLLDVLRCALLQIHADQVDVTQWVLPCLALLSGVGLFVWNRGSAISTSYPQG